MRLMCDRNIVDKMITEKQMGILRLKETVDGLAKTNGTG